MDTELNVAYTDGAVSVNGVAGWGVWWPGPPALRLFGTVNTRDVTVAELWAVLMAVKRAPAGQALTVSTDAQSLPEVIRGAADRQDVQDLALKVREAAGRREVALAVVWASREEAGQRAAHDLAVSGRTRPLRVKPKVQVTVRPAEGGHLQVTVTRHSQRTTMSADLAWRPGEDAALHAALGILDNIRKVELRVGGTGGDDRVARQALRVLQSAAPGLTFMLSTVRAD